MEEEIYYTRVLPLVRYIEIEKNGRKQTYAIDNLSKSELISLPIDKACMLWDDNSGMYIAESPLSYKAGSSIKFSIVYLYDELTIEEQEKYFERTIVLPLKRKPVVKVYGENSKRIFPKRKIKKEGNK